MRNYDLTFIFSPLLAEREVNDLFQRLVSFVQEQGGILEDQRLLGRKPLLSPIRDSKEGYLATIAFSLNPENLPALKKTCGETSQILRFLITQQIKKSQKAPAVRTPVSQLTITQKKKEKIDLKGLEEKLEEIFSETSPAGESNQIREANSQ